LTTGGSGAGGGVGVGVGAGTGGAASYCCTDTLLASMIASMTKTIPALFMCNLLLTKTVFLLRVDLRANQVLTEYSPIYSDFSNT
jgi:hypothetical protein